MRRITVLVWFLCLCQIAHSSFLSSNATQIQPDPVEGGWTTNIFKAREVADARHIPMVMFATSTGCSYCNRFHMNVWADKRFHKHIEDRGYIGVIVEAQSGNWTSADKREILDHYTGYGTLPHITCYWSRADGTSLDPLGISIHANRESYDYYVEWMEGYLGDYKKSTDPVVTPQTPTQSATTNVVRYGKSIITVDYPENITEGDSGTLMFNRTGETVERVTLHVLTNGFWFSDVTFDENDSSTKVLRLPVGITDEFDDGRKVTIYLRTLNRSVVTTDGSDVGD